MGLGLPLQGPGWTECAHVRGFVQVNRGGQCVHVAPVGELEIDFVHVFGHLKSLWSVINILAPTTFTLAFSL